MTFTLKYSENRRVAVAIGGAFILAVYWETSEGKDHRGRDNWGSLPKDQWLIGAR